MSAEPREPRQGLHALHWEMPAGRRNAELLFQRGGPLPGPDADYTYQGFAQLVLEAERPCTAGPRQAGAEQMQSPPPET